MNYFRWCFFSLCVPLHIFDSVKKEPIFVITPVIKAAIIQLSPVQQHDIQTELRNFFIWKKKVFLKNVVFFYKK
jgi:hypothetical protein